MAFPKWLKRIHVHLVFTPSTRRRKGATEGANATRNELKRCLPKPPELLRRKWADDGMDVVFFVLHLLPSWCRKKIKNNEKIFRLLFESSAHFSSCVDDVNISQVMTRVCEPIGIQGPRFTPMNGPCTFLFFFRLWRTADVWPPTLGENERGECARLGTSFRPSPFTNEGPARRYYEGFITWKETLPVLSCVGITNPGQLCGVKPAENQRWRTDFPFLIETGLFSKTTKNLLSFTKNCLPPLCEGIIGSVQIG